VKILLIAGHGQGDAGAIGCGYCEADLTREFVSLVKDKLSAYATVEVADMSVNWFNNKAKLPTDGVDYALEVHFNACVNDAKGNGSTTGTEIYVTTREKGTTVEENIVAGMASFGLKNRGVKRKNWSVINHCKSRGISSALLEVCFIDDADDMLIYTAKKHDMADAVTNAIARGFGLKKQEDELHCACKLLASAGIINSPDYWAKGGGYSDSNVVLLIKSFARYVRGL
jgi:N-acetylmuramoyl-L-alanine amidase